MRTVNTATAVALSLLGGTAFGQCDPTAPRGSIMHNDPDVCDGSDAATDPNGGCYGSSMIQDLGALDAGTHYISGTIGSDKSSGSYDNDWFHWSIEEQALMTITVSSTNPLTGDLSYSPGWFLGTGSDCSDFQFTVGPTLAESCGFVSTGPNQYMAQGDYIFATQPYFLWTEVECPARIPYLIQIDIRYGEFTECGDPAGESCAEAHATGGCSDFPCCELICEYDHACCDSEWDSSCVESAYTFCDIYFYECDSAGPANNCAADAESVSIPLYESGISVPFDTTHATTNGPYHSQCGSDPQLHKDVWFKVEAPIDGFMYASTCNQMNGTPPNWDTTIAAYGPYTDFPNDFNGQYLPEDYILCNDNHCPGGGDASYSSSLTFEATGGNTYLIRIGGYNGDEYGSGNCFFDFIPYECEPTNQVYMGDNNVTNIGAPLSSLSFEGLCELSDPNVIFSNCAFYRFEAEVSSEAMFATCNQAAWDTSIALLAGSTCNPADVLACNGDAPGCSNYSSRFYYDIVAGNVYTVVVGGWGSGNVGHCTLTIETDPCDDPDRNTCANPHDIHGEGTYAITTLPCNNAVGYNGFCDMGPFGCDCINHPYWFSFVPPTTDLWTFSTCNSSTILDTRIGFQANCDSGTVFACLDDTEKCPNYTTELSWILEAGIEYVIVVGGYGANDYGDMVVTVSIGDPPDDPCEDYTNDCDDPEVVAGPGDYPFDTTCALAAGNRNFDMAGFCDPGDFGNDVVWNTYYFEFTATADGDYTFSTCNQASFDTRLVVASSCDPSTTIACNDDGTDDSGADCEGFTSNIDVPLTAGTYIVGVGGYAAGNAGTGLLTVLGPEDPDCPGDFNGDGVVDGADLTILLGDWGGGAADLNGDGLVDGADLTILLGNWGNCA